MNAHSLWQRLTNSGPGKVVLCTVLAFVAIVVVKGCQPKTTAPEFVRQPQSEPVGERTRPGVDFPKTPRPAASAPAKEVKAIDPLPPLTLYVSANGTSPSHQPRLPSRRLVSCQLVNTVDSSSLETPIIALVTDDVWFHDELVIPKGTEVHGQAQGEYMRDRVASHGAWTLIWPSGAEATFNGIALDRDRTNNSWGITDGSAGLRGALRKADNLDETKLFVATFLSGMTEVFQDRQNTIIGQRVVASAKNAALSGSSEIVQSYAQRLLQSIERNAIFVRVPAGTPFYLYLTDSVTEPKR